LAVSSGKVNKSATHAADPAVNNLTGKEGSFKGVTTGGVVTDINWLVVKVAAIILILKKKMNFKRDFKKDKVKINYFYYYVNMK